VSQLWRRLKIRDGNVFGWYEGQGGILQTSMTISRCIFPGDLLDFSCFLQTHGFMRSKRDEHDT